MLYMFNIGKTPIPSNFTYRSNLIPIRADLIFFLEIDKLFIKGSDKDLEQPKNPEIKPKQFRELVLIIKLTANPHPFAGRSVK